MASDAIQRSFPGMETPVEAIRFELAEPLAYRRVKSKPGVLSELALGSADRLFDAIQLESGDYEIHHTSGARFSVSARKLSGKNKHRFKIVGEVRRLDLEPTVPYNGFRIEGKSDDGKSLRPAQVGALYALLSHWSLSREVATIVLPTGTGKTETMLAASIADQANRTLVVVPSIELKDQISESFAQWGILRKLGVIAKTASNPAVFVMKQTLGSKEDLQIIEKSDVVITTPGLLARAKPGLLEAVSDKFTHVFFDEAHHVAAKEWSFLKELFNSKKIVQFTATPYRTDRQPIEGRMVYNYPLSQALADDCFSKVSLVSVDERHPKKKDRAIADAAMQRLTEDRQNGLDRHRMMVRAGGKSDAERLFELYSEWFPNERIALVHSGIKGRKSIIADIKAGKYDIIVCVDMLKEGFDFPELKIAAVHSVHKSLSVLLQFIGRFARTQNGLGDASFVVNFADERMSTDLEELFQEGSGWEKVISEIADAKKADAESLLAFLQGCEPYSGFDAPDIELHPKLVYPALSCMCFKADKADWSKFTDGFNLKKYAISHPYFNKDENVFYFATQKRERVKWARSRKMADQKWDLVVMHFDTDSRLLYVGLSDKKLDIGDLIETITGKAASIINGDDVFRSFDDIKRLSIVHAGIFKPANHLHRYSRLSGADVTTELSRWKEGKRCKKSDFVGVGFRDGFPVSIGASVKGKVWSPARAGDLQEWTRWCLEIGRMLTDESINSNQLLENSAERIEIAEYPQDLVVLATDWTEQLYDRMHKLTLERPGQNSFMLSECSILYLGSSGDTANFSLIVMEDTYPFSITLGGEQGHSVHGLEKINATIEGLKSKPLGLTQFFAENPPTLFLLNSCTISGCIHTDYGEVFEVQIPSDRVTVLDWIGVDLTIESMFKGKTARSNSIQEYMMKHLVDRGARIVFNDDNSGESADIVAVFVKKDTVRFELVHCKYSKAKVGSRLSDLYEVCGQAIVSLRYKWKPEELLRHMQRRNGVGVLTGKRFYQGDNSDIEEVAKALKYSEVEFEFAIAQPGVDANSLSLDQKNLLGSVYSTIVEMTETKLLCYFNKSK